MRKLREWGKTAGYRRSSWTQMTLPEQEPLALLVTAPPGKINSL